MGGPAEAPEDEQDSDEALKARFSELLRRFWHPAEPPAPDSHGDRP